MHEAIEEQYFWPVVRRRVYDGGRLAALEIEHYPGMAEEEIARVALFLALDTSAGMTGQTMNVDCGSIMN